MKPVNRVLRSAGLALVALFLAAGSAQAISGLSSEMCPDPTAAAESIAEFYDDASDRIDTSEFEEKDCAKLCKEMDKVCSKAAKSAGTCIKDGDKFVHKLAKALCGGEPECLAVVKADQSADKEDLAASLEQADTNCAGLGEQCLAACAAGEVFPLEL